MAGLFPGTAEVKTEEHGELVQDKLVSGGSFGNEVGTGLPQLSQPRFSVLGWMRLVARGYGCLTVLSVHLDPTTRTAAGPGRGPR